MDLKQFGKQLQILRKEAGVSQEQLIETLDQLARPGPQTEYRVIDGTLLSRWENARTQKGRTWKPTRTYTLHLIQLFAPHLDLARAQAWATLAGHTIRTAELQAWFPAATANVPPESADQTARVPTPPTALIGRKAEIATAIALLQRDDVWLVTLSGPGGSGKTRLALEIAFALAPDFADGVFIVDPFVV